MTIPTKSPGRNRGFQIFRERSVPREARAAPVEAIDEFGRDGLHVRMSAIECVVRSNCAARPDDANRKVVLAAVVGEAILALPEQPGDQPDRIFGAAAEEPAMISAARQRSRSRREPGGVTQICGVEAGLGVAAVHIGQKAGQCDIADATTDGPGPVKLVRMQISPEANKMKETPY